MGPFELHVARGYRPSSEELCQLATDIIKITHDPSRCVRVAIVIEMDDGSKRTFEHDVRLCERWSANE